MILDLFSAIEARDAGMQLAASSKSDLVDKVRYQLERIALGRPDHTVTIDDAAPFLEAAGEGLGNAAGSVFKHEMWEFTGRFVASKRVSSHGRYVREWRLK